MEPIPALADDYDSRSRADLLEGQLETTIALLEELLHLLEPHKGPRGEK